ncbi:MULTISPECIES: S8 family serine peptidase [unclassified Leptospira]|uniref:S8 family serine peptidase n=1 Tax=unclassified Leptospira TaxID=2633828 RepID=UPI0002BE0201|nr:MULTISPECIES: S8 family serine peptidase [unclassified Leptospira]EMK00514.1 thermitase family protein [Leptospira sp. B5-022]MCR1792231.1 S8 family serine peptidase [Leptospira sp. id769339]
MKNKFRLFALIFSIFSIGYLFAEKETYVAPNWSKLLDPVGNTDNKKYYKKDSKRKFKSSEILVKFKDNAGDSVKSYAVGSFNGKVLNNLDETGISQVELREGQSVEEALAEYSSHPDVEFVQPNYIYHASTSPNDPIYGQLWGMNNTGQVIATASYSGPPTNNPGTSGDDMRMESAWDVNTDCSNTIVAILDSGVNYNHTDLNENMWGSASCVSDKGVSLGSCSNGWDYADNDSNPMDLNGHGTHVAGTIGAKGNNGTGVAGVCWTAKIMAVRVLDQLGSGDTATIIKGINFAVRNGAKVLNLSLGGPDYDSAMRSAIANAGRKYDALFVVAAGNEDNDLKSDNSYPCEYDEANILCVAALDQKFQLASFSNYDSSKKRVDIGAPGTNIRSTWAGAEATSSLAFASWTKSNYQGTDWNSTNCPPTVLYLSTSCATAILGTSNSGYTSNTYALTFAPITILSGADAVTARMNLFLDTEAGFDGINMYTSVSGNEFDIFNSVNRVGSLSGETNGKLISNFEVAAPNCVGSSNCSFGYEFISDSSINRAGVAITAFNLITLDIDNINQYNTINGTSMATPHVAGIAALLRSFNPKFTYSDTIKAIISGGTSTSSLQNITKYGKAANGDGAIRNLEAPMDLSIDVP